jgi:hypothetical protein
MVPDTGGHAALCPPYRKPRILKDLGYIPVIFETALKKHQGDADFVTSNIHRANCCLQKAMRSSMDCLPRSAWASISL